MPRSVATKKKRKPAAPPKAKPKRTPKPKPASDLPTALLDLLAPTLRAYAEEELHILTIAHAHPALGERFVRARIRRRSHTVPPADRRAFREAMRYVDVPARARLVIGKLEEYWGETLDAETKRGVRDDVRAMYAGE